MDIQTRKLIAIEYLIGLHDEKILSKIEYMICEIKDQQAHKKTLKPFTQKELIVRANRSNKDYLDGKYKTQEQLESESEKW